MFLYGTLLPAVGTTPLADRIAALPRLGPASIAGRLYNVGLYPGLRLDEARGRVHGGVFAIDDACLLAEIDDYEGFPPEAPQHSLFVRRTVTAELTGGVPVVCWVYVYNRDTTGAVLIEHGDYVRWLKEREAS